MYVGIAKGPTLVVRAACTLGAGGGCLCTVVDVVVVGAIVVVVVVGLLSTKARPALKAETSKSNDRS